MKKQTIGLVSIFLLLGMFSGCDSNDVAVNITNTPTVVVESSSDSFLAASDYCTLNDYELVECGSEYDAVVFVENGKYDYTVLDSLTHINTQECGLEYVEDCTYKVEYCLSFSSDDLVFSGQFDDAIKALNDDGTIDALTDNYINGRANELPSTTGPFITVLCCPYFDDRLYVNEAGSVVGLDAEIMTAICAYLGYTPIFVAVEYDEFSGMLIDGEGDVALMVDRVSDMYNGLTYSNAYLVKTFDVYKRAEK